MLRFPWVSTILSWKYKGSRGLMGILRDRWEKAVTNPDKEAVELQQCRGVMRVRVPPCPASARSADLRP